MALTEALFDVVRQRKPQIQVTQRFNAVRLLILRFYSRGFIPSWNSAYAAETNIDRAYGEKPIQYFV